MAPRKRAAARKSRAADPSGVVPEVQGDDGQPVPTEDAVGRVPPAPAARRGDRAERPTERPAPTVDVRQLDELLDGLFSWPVELQDMYDVAAAVREMWPGCMVEAKHYHGVEVHITAGWDDWHRGPQIHRVVRQPGVEPRRPTILPVR